MNPGHINSLFLCTFLAIGAVSIYPKNAPALDEMQNQAYESLKQANHAYQSRDYKTAFSVLIDLLNDGRLVKFECDQYEAQYLLGLLYAGGGGTDKSHTRALHWFRQAADNGHVSAITNLAYLFAIGKGESPDEDYAATMYLLEQLARPGGKCTPRIDPGFYYASNVGVENDVHQAVSKLIRSAELGDSKAQLALGVLHSMGKGVDRDYAKALNLYQRAAEQGLAAAQFALGMSYRGDWHNEGFHEQVDTNKALYWISKAAQAGHAGAQYYLGGLYESSNPDNGVTRDKSRAVYWYHKAAEQGHVDAQYALGHNMFCGSENREMAIYWLKQAAEQGHALAQSQLNSLTTKRALCQ